VAYTLQQITAALPASNRLPPLPEDVTNGTIPIDNYVINLVTALTTPEAQIESAVERASDRRNWYRFSIDENSIYQGRIAIPVETTGITVAG